MDINIFNPLLDSLVFRKDCPACTLRDMKDHINMREKNLPVRVQFESIKPCWITESGETIWQICHKANDIETGITTIGNPLYGSLPFMKELYRRLLLANSK